MAFAIADLKNKWQPLLPTEDVVADATWTLILADAQEEAEADIGRAPVDTSAMERQLVLYYGAKGLRMMKGILKDAESSGAGSTTFPTMGEINKRIKYLREKITAKFNWYHQDND